jgi:hypothetical protein
VKRDEPAIRRDLQHADIPSYVAWLERLQRIVKPRSPMAEVIKGWIARAWAAEDGGGFYA